MKKTMFTFIFAVFCSMAYTQSAQRVDLYGSGGVNANQAFIMGSPHLGFQQVGNNTCGQVYTYVGPLAKNDNCTAINDIKKPEAAVKVYPTSSSSVVSVEKINTDEWMKIYLYDLNGNMLQTEKFTSSKMELNISLLAQGMYLLQVYNKNSEPIQNCKLIKL